ncbi:hypothetical protein FC75_GL000874 [Lacticaseibacillus camelliae DSM 22697 = JCM 13995]|uniref:Uncharacterized protein n=2 Tax=Lacticaseibacillus camelliae TaxID=381742 RepID=A0A0R2ERX3_9LACO|nr:hypothetical protein FC75_GL000874 [Lacticaseibacillus camelliae DSM 22697 = JCM 13995]
MFAANAVLVWMVFATNISMNMVNMTHAMWLMAIIMLADSIMSLYMMYRKK